MSINVPTTVSHVNVFLDTYLDSITSVSMVFLTVFVALGIWQQVRALKRQGDIANRQADLIERQVDVADRQLTIQDELMQLEKDRVINKVKIIGASVTGGDEPDCVGFALINEGQTSVRISSWWFDPGIKQEDPHISINTQPPFFFYEGIVSLEDKLFPGDSFQILFHKERLIDWMNWTFDSDRHRVRFFCQDSIGNKFSTDYWTEWTERGSIIHGSPMPGYRPSSE